MLNTFVKQSLLGNFGHEGMPELLVRNGVQSLENFFNSFVKFGDVHAPIATCVQLPEDNPEHILGRMLRVRQRRPAERPQRSHCIDEGAILARMRERYSEVSLQLAKCSAIQSSGLSELSEGTTTQIITTHIAAMLQLVDHRKKQSFFC